MPPGSDGGVDPLPGTYSLVLGLHPYPYSGSRYYRRCQPQDLGSMSDRLPRGPGPPEHVFGLCLVSSLILSLVVNPHVSRSLIHFLFSLDCSVYLSPHFSFCSPQSIMLSVSYLSCTKLWSLPHSLLSVFLDFAYPVLFCWSTELACFPFLSLPIDLDPSALCVYHNKLFYCNCIHLLSANLTIISTKLKEIWSRYMHGKYSYIE